jgi:UDP:flavonoid glycosyltransferase YjiC (YdhE family)
MATILFVTWDGGGNLPPALGVAAQLRERGDTVRFLGHRPQRERIEAAGFPFEPYTRARAWSATAPASAARVFAMFNDAGPGVDLLASLAREPADLVVVDCMSLGALKAANAAGLPYAVLAHTFFEYLLRRWSRGPIGIVAALNRQRPSRLWMSARAVVVTAMPDLDPAGRRDLPPTVTHVGPVWPPGSAPPAPAALDGERILVSLSTVHYPGQARALQSIVDAVAGLPVRAIVTTGDAVDAASLRVPGNVELHRHLPHDEVMPQVSLVVGHGGHGTAMRALAHDLPLLAMPMHAMLDQPMVASVLQEQGAARTVRRSTPSHRLRAAIADLLAPGPHRAAAARLGAAIRARNGASAAADLVASLTAPHR